MDESKLNALTAELATLLLGQKPDTEHGQHGNCWDTRSNRLSNTEADWPALWPTPISSTTLKGSAIEHNDVAAWVTSVRGPLTGLGVRKRNVYGCGGSP
ncbi:hypothetical protein HF675_03710 [Serratia sp. JUb9]|uniref:hypothetical protein n=1 Tax=Serratia sp. JUb9 TaxID=2724469 RepID=UPI00164DBEB5|nr:hypothetical protein [Serratia sp. JUb9]QNK33185.1 hypothetical protein HF675_03710 [Serratia sp. JUb9]